MASVGMWPEPVERIAAFLRDAQVEGRIEELPAGTGSYPGTAVYGAGFEADRKRIVALIPSAREVDRTKLAAAAESPALRPAPAPAFPFEGASVFVDRAVFAGRVVWLEAGSGRHVVGIAPQDLARLTRAKSADLTVDA